MQIRICLGEFRGSSNSLILLLMMNVDPNLPEPEKCLLDFRTSNYDQASMLSAGFSTRKSAVEEVLALAVRYMLGCIGGKVKISSDLVGDNKV